MYEILISNGFKLIHQCSCGGTMKQTFKKTVRNQTYEVNVRPKRNTWDLMLLNSKVANGNKENLIEKLKENGLIF